MVSSVGVVGASARAAVHSLIRAGYSAWAIDRFTDRDLKRTAAAVVCPVDQYPDAIPGLAKQFPPSRVLYTGGLENDPHILRRLEQHHRLWGTPPDALGPIRNPFRLAELAAEAGWSMPRLVPLNATCPNDGCWLRKLYHSSGGHGIRFAQPNEPASPRHYFQEYLDGAPRSAVFVDDTLFGITEQLIGQPWLHAKPFAYCGNMGPVALPQPDWGRLGQQLSQARGASAGPSPLSLRSEARITLPRRKLRSTHPPAHSAATRPAPTPTSAARPVALSASNRAGMAIVPEFA